MGGGRGSRDDDPGGGDPRGGPPSGQPEGGDAATPLPIDGTLDLHTFRPGEVKDLVRDYVEECRRLGILEVRIIHGKGTGTLKAVVESVLSKMPQVVSFRPGGHGAGGWGATLANLAPMGEDRGKKP